MPDFDTDTRSSRLSIGIELEYPRRGSDELFVHRGRDSDDLRRRVDHVGRPDANPVYDGTVGLEVVSSVLELQDAVGWYHDVLEYLNEEHGEEHQPTGLMRRGSTAGLHIHLSSLSESQAQELYRMSTEPWLQVLVCTSIAVTDDQPTWPVFRGGSYCRPSYDEGRYSVVNSRGGGGHYEWRLPEPMTPGNVEVLAKFLRAFEQSPEAAREYGQRVLNDADDRITSILRAEAVGMDIGDIPLVNREPHPDDPENFYEEVASRSWLPQIHQVEYGSEHYYVFDTQMEGSWEVADVTFSHDDVIIASELEIPEDPVVEEVRRAYDVTNRADGPERETEATHELKKIVKKKKGT